MKTSRTIEEAMDNYAKGKPEERKPSDAVMGFIKKNEIVGKTDEEIDALVMSAEKLSNGEILGEGDKFRKWCGENGRELPNDDLVREMNRDPFGAAMAVRKNIPAQVSVWRSWCTYRAGKGRHRV